MNRESERGSVLVLVGLSLFFLFVVIGAAIDFGLLSFVRNQGQAAVDAAALAGASGLPAYVKSGGNASKTMARIAALDGANQVQGAPADLGGGAAGTSIDFLVYDEQTDEVTCESGCDPDRVNAVRVTRAGYTTPLFFSWARSAFAESAAPSQRVDVSAIGYLGCPSEIEPRAVAGLGPIALRECKIGFPDSCDVSSILQSSTATDNSAFTTFNRTGTSTCRAIAEGDLPSGLQTRIAVGDTINLVGSGQSASCLKAFDDRYAHCTAAKCATSPPDPSCVVTLPVIDCAGSESEGVVVGFATACIRDVQSPPQPKIIDASVMCGADVPGPPGGVCSGTFARQPVLVR